MANDIVGLHGSNVGMGNVFTEGPGLFHAGRACEHARAGVDAAQAQIAVEEHVLIAVQASPGTEALDAVLNPPVPVRFTRDRNTT